MGGQRVVDQVDQFLDLVRVVLQRCACTAAGQSSGGEMV